MKSADVEVNSYRGYFCFRNRQMFSNKEQAYIKYDDMRQALKMCLSYITSAYFELTARKHILK